jgi:hypothetical protein
MLRALSLFVVGLCANVVGGRPAFAQSPAEVTLARIDCGTGATPTDVGQRLNDTFAYKDYLGHRLERNNEAAIDAEQRVQRFLIRHLGP